MSDDWYDVLTGKREPENREQEIFSALRSRIQQDAKPDAEHTLSELDLRRGQNRLRKAVQPNTSFSGNSFLSGIAAGIVAAGVSLGVYFQLADDPLVDKGVPDSLTPVINLERNAPETFSPDLLELTSRLTQSGIDFELAADGGTLYLVFRTPAPVPAIVAEWFAANQMEAQAATRYEIHYQ